jgi:hypothetical protein
VVDAFVLAAEAEGPAVVQAAVGGKAAELEDRQAARAKMAPLPALVKPQVTASDHDFAVSE